MRGAFLQLTAEGMAESGSVRRVHRTALDGSEDGGSQEVQLPPEAESDQPLVASKDWGPHVCSQTELNEPGSVLPPEPPLETLGRLTP